MNGGNENIDKLFKDAFSGDQFTMDKAMWADANALIKESKPTPNYFEVIGVTVAVLAVIGTTTFFFTGDKLSANHQSYSERTSTEILANLTSVNDIEDTYFSDILFTNRKHQTTNAPEETSSNLNANNSDTKTNTNNYTNNSTRKKNSPKPLITNTASMANSSANTSTSVNSKNQSATTPTEFSTRHTAFISDRKNTASPLEYYQDHQLISDQSPKEEFIRLATNPKLTLPNEPPSVNPSAKNGASKTQMFVPFTLRLSAGYGIGSVLNQLNTQTKYTANQTNIALSLEYSFTPKWGVQTGVSYFQTNETQTYNGLSVQDNSYFNLQDNSYFDYFDTEITVEDKTWWLGEWWIYGTYQDTIVDSNYVTQIDSNLVQKFDSTQTDVTETQKITQLEIPVLVTYTFVHKRWVFQVATGASFGMFLNSQGKMIRFEDDLVTGINSSKDFFNSLQYNYLLSAEAGFALNEHWRITARPQLKVNLNSMFNTESGYSQKYLFYGLNVGMAFNF